MTPTAPITRREPALLVSIAVGAVIGVGGFLTAWGGGIDWRLALGGALTAWGTSVIGGAVVRSQAYSPATADTIMDAHAVIEAAEIEGRG